MERGKKVDTTPEMVLSYGIRRRLSKCLSVCLFICHFRLGYMIKYSEVQNYL